MKSTLRNAALGMAFASLGLSTAASAATETAQAEAEILASLSVELDATANELNFGQIAQNGAAGTAQLAPTTGALTCSSSLVCAATGASPNFDLTGEPGYTVGISFTDSTISLTGPTGTTAMTVALASSASTVVLNSSGSGTFNVGGTLAVGANQGAGVYSGQLEVVALYQ